MTHYRALGYVDRAAVREGAPIRVVMASEGKQADGIDLRMSGAQLDRFRRNPVLGYGHAYWGRMNLPIGRVDPGSIAIDGPRMLGDLTFDAADPFAVEVERKMREGFINAVSIGFNVTRWEDPKSNYWTGGVAETWELTELSVVPVPMDSAAVVESGRDLTDADVPALVRALAHRLGIPAVSPPAPEPEPEPEVLSRAVDPDPEPAVPAIDTEAARTVLAAFNL